MVPWVNEYSLSYYLEKHGWSDDWAENVQGFLQFVMGVYVFCAIAKFINYSAFWLPSGPGDGNLWNGGGEGKPVNSSYSGISRAINYRNTKLGQTDNIGKSRIYRETGWLDTMIENSKENPNVKKTLDFIDTQLMNRDNESGFEYLRGKEDDKK